MPTEVIHVIAADGTGDYTTLAAWQTAQVRNLVTADQIAVAEIKGVLSITGGFQVTGGWVFDSSHYVLIRPIAGQECLGRISGEGFAKITSTGWQPTIRLNSWNIIQDLYLENLTTGDGGQALSYDEGGGKAFRCVLATNNGRTNYDGTNNAGVVVNLARSDHSLHSCIAIQKGASNYPVIFGANNSGGNKSVINCVAIGNGQSAGFRDLVNTSTKPLYINCVSYNNLVDFDIVNDDYHVNSRNNAGATNSANLIPGSNSVTDVVLSDFEENTWFSSATGKLFNAGYNHGLFSTDIRGEVIVDWSIGAAVDGAASPSISLSGVYAPGQTITAVLSNFVGTPTQATLTDSANNSMVRVLTPAGNDYTFTLPDLPAPGNNTAGLLFGDVTVTIDDPGV